MISNYCAHALDFFANTEIGRATPGIYSRSTESIFGALEAMRDGEKFVMPDYGRVFEGGTRRGDFRDLLRLPYPVCVLEYFCPKPIINPDVAVVAADFFPKRRIAILFDLAQLGTKGRESGVMVSGCCEIEDGFWTFLPAAAILDPETINVDPDTGLFHVTPVPFLREAWEQPRYTLQEKIYDIADEATAAVEFMMAVNCDNVKRERIEPSAKLNKKRLASGKEPFSSYWMLDIFKDAAAHGNGHGVGGHASPRRHFRRGHIRRLASGKTTFVRHTMVGNGEQGVIQKIYNIKGKAA